MEKMFELLEENIDVEDEPNAPDLDVNEGRIEFEDVHFKYNDVDKEILSGISFTYCS